MTIEITKEGLLPEDKQLIKDLLDTLTGQVDPEGSGLAAPQIGVNKRAFVFKHRGQIEVVLNPKILQRSSETNIARLGREKMGVEGCLSVPNLYAYIERPWEIDVEYQSKAGKTIQKNLQGMEAVCFLHENDHLEGVLFIDRARKQGEKLYEIKQE